MFGDQLNTNNPRGGSWYKYNWESIQILSYHHGINKDDDNKSKGHMVGELLVSNPKP